MFTWPLECPRKSPYDKFEDLSRDQGRPSRIDPDRVPGGLLSRHDRREVFEEILKIDPGILGGPTAFGERRLSPAVSS